MVLEMISVARELQLSIGTYTLFLIHKTSTPGIEASILSSSGCSLSLTHELRSRFLNSIVAMNRVPLSLMKFNVKLASLPVSPAWTTLSRFMLVKYDVFRRSGGRVKDGRL